ncbi:hypothetical protein B0H12DRAFT_1077933 [Mycena haematopus]|nr:hypothetical protein B0H12DRAFT_1077933 [Mycena haematopus]
MKERIIVDTRFLKLEVRQGRIITNDKEKKQKFRKSKHDLARDRTRIFRLVTRQSINQYSGFESENRAVEKGMVIELVIRMTRRIKQLLREDTVKRIFECAPSISLPDVSSSVLRAINVIRSKIFLLSNRRLCSVMGRGMSLRQTRDADVRRWVLLYFSEMQDPSASKFLLVLQCRRYRMSSRQHGLPTPTYGSNDIVLTVCAELAINAPLAAVYNAILDFNAYPARNTRLHRDADDAALLPPFNTTSNDVLTVLDFADAAGSSLLAWRYDDGLSGVGMRAEHPNVLVRVGGGVTRVLSFAKPNYTAFEKQASDVKAYLERG